METLEMFEGNNPQLELMTDMEDLRMTNRILESELAEKKKELEKAHFNLAKANEEILELENVKAEFLSIISHEVRTSLNGILGSILLIRDKLNDCKYSDLFNILISSATRLENFSLTALSITELRTGAKCFPKKEINLNRFIRDILDSDKKLSTQKNIKFELNIVSEKTVIYGDKQLLQQCFKGILENAVIYSPPGGTVYIRAVNEQNTISCEVSDEGPGFSDFAMKNLFKLFRPGEPHIDQNNGLDLTLARLIMEAHSGRIEVENMMYGGARVKLVFPGCGEGMYCN